MRQQIRVVVFASGRGSTFQAIHKALAAMEAPPARIVLCISNNPRPGAFEYAESAGVETLRLSPRMFEQEAEYERALLDVLRERGIEMIVLAGYMRQLPPGAVQTYRGHILNIHPALLPKFGGKGMYGMHVHEAVIAAGETETGPTVHLVDEEYDTGPIVAQERVPVLPGDTAESLAARVLQAEHELYARVVIDHARAMLAERAAKEETL
jgi:phosphoribosylglycinamide formyltransferase-1